MSAKPEITRPTLSAKERRRLFDLHGGQCHLCELPIDPVRQAWEVEHVKPRWAHRDPREADTDENMKPAHTSCHKTKTKVESKSLAKAKRAENKHEGMKKSRTPLPAGRNSGVKLKIGGGVEPRAKPAGKPMPPRQPLYK